MASITGRLSEATDLPTCPACNKEVTSDLRWYKCHDNKCAKAGDAWDYLLSVETRHVAICQILNAICDREFTEEELHNVINSARSEKALSDAIKLRIGKSYNVGTVSPEVSTTFAWLRRLGIDHACQTSSLCVVTSKDIKELSGVSRFVFPDEKWPESNKPLIMIPYWACPGVLHSLMFLDTGTNPKSTCVEISSSFRTGFTGLTDVDVTAGGLTLRDTAYDALQENSHNAKFGRDKFAIAARHNRVAMSRTYAWLPDRLSISRETLRPSYVELAVSVASHGVNLQIDYEGTVMAWGDYLPRAVFQKLSTSTDVTTLTVEEQTLLTACKFSSQTRRAIVKELGQVGLIKKAEALLRSENNRALCEVGGGVLHEIDGKYVVEKINGTRTPVTNFALRLKKCVLFVDSASMAISAGLECGDFSGDVNIPVDTFHTIQSFERAMSATRLQKTGKVDTVKEVPIVFNRASAKHLLAHLLTETATLPRVEGISKFGWNDDCSAYYTTFGKYTQDALDPDVNVIRDTAAVGGGLNTANPITPNTECPTECWLEVFAAMLSSVYRAHQKMAPRNMQFLHGADTLKHLEVLFARLGQKFPVTVNTRGNDIAGSDVLNAASGYPLLIVNHSRADGGQIGGHMVLSANARIPLALTHPEQGVAEAWAYVLQRLVNALTSGKCQDASISGIDSTSSAIREGFALLRLITDWQIPEVTAHSTALDEWLGGIPHHRVNEFATLHIARQVVAFSLRDVSEALVNSIRIFASSRNNSYASTSEGFEIDAIGAISMLTEFYGVSPQLARHVDMQIVEGLVTDATSATVPTS